MKIAYLLLCHMDPRFVKRTAKKLVSEKNHVFIHVDKKQDIKEYLFDNSNVHFCKNRVVNTWGGWNSIVATINIIKDAMKVENFDRYVLLQGQDYPLYSNEYIEKYFKRYNDIEFCRAYNLTNTKDCRDAMKIYGYWFLDQPKNKSIKFLRYPLKKITSMLNKKCIKYRRGFYSKSKKRYLIYSGWAQWALTGECVKYIINFYDNNPKFNFYFKHSFPPDETYFHTIIYNSEFVHKTLDRGAIEKRNNESLLNLTYFEYPDQIRVFKSIDDYSKLIKSGYLFARKLNSSSEELLDYIDSN